MNEEWKAKISKALLGNTNGKGGKGKIKSLNHRINLSNSRKKWGYLSRGYIRTKILGKEYSMHRLIWEKSYGKIPDDYDIHHKDGDKQNNELNNLELINHKLHSKITATKRWNNAQK